MLAEADELIVLSDDLRGAFGEVESERSLVCTEVVDVKDKLLGEVFGFTPDDPAHTGVHLWRLVGFHVMELLKGSCSPIRICGRKC